MRIEVKSTSRRLIIVLNGAGPLNRFRLICKSIGICQMTSLANPSPAHLRFHADITRHDVAVNWYNHVELLTWTIRKAAPLFCLAENKLRASGPASVSVRFNSSHLSLCAG
jgi:hypothetical protein